MIVVEMLTYKDVSSKLLQIAARTCEMKQMLPVDTDCGMKPDDSNSVYIPKAAKRFSGSSGLTCK